MKTVLGIITKNSDVLVGRIKTEKVNDYGGLMYAFPSGQLDGNENPKDLISKEIKEQLDLDVNIVSKIGERVHPITGNWTEYYHCISTDSGKIYLSKDSDIQEFLWISFHKLFGYMPTLYEPVKAYLENL